jgi:hypothetical protein
MSDNEHIPWPTYLWPLLWKLFQVGCGVKHSLRKWLKWIHQAGSSARHKATCLAFQAEASGARVHFDMDSIPIGVDIHASQCMANDKRLFEDLCLDQAEQQVGRINDGLVIAGRRTMVITINDNSGRPHKIKIPNSLFLPDLRVCLLLPQHWAKEARDNYHLLNGTRMENNATNCTLIWGQGHVVPMEITFMDMKDAHSKYGTLRSLRYIYSNPFRFPIASLGLPIFLLSIAERERWRDMPTTTAH